MTVPGVWPYPRDSPTGVKKRVAGAYRSRLSEVDPIACDELDRQMLAYGQGWVVTRIVSHEPDEWLSVKEAAKVACVSVPQIGRMRREGVLQGRKIGHRWQYRNGDVLAAMARG